MEFPLLFFILKMSYTDLEILIADYYATTGHAIESQYTIKPSVNTSTDLPKTGNNEGDVRKVKDTGRYNIFDEGEWHELTPEIGDNDALSKSDFEQVLDESFASDDEVLQAILLGKEAANIG